MGQAHPPGELKKFQMSEWASCCARVFSMGVELRGGGDHFMKWFYRKRGGWASTPSCPSLASVPAVSVVIADGVQWQDGLSHGHPRLRGQAPAGQGDPSSGLHAALPPRDASRLCPPPPPSRELKIAVWFLCLIVKDWVVIFPKCFICSQAFCIPGDLPAWVSQPPLWLPEKKSRLVFLFQPSPALVTSSLGFSDSVSSVGFPLSYLLPATPAPRCVVLAWSNPGTPHPPSSVLSQMFLWVHTHTRMHTHREKAELICMLLNRLDTHLRSLLWDILVIT